MSCVLVVLPMDDVDEAFLGAKSSLLARHDTQRARVFWFFFSNKNRSKRFFLKKEAKTFFHSG
jgi:hypothetical protein